MGRINSNRIRKLKRLEASSIKSKQKKREIEKDINHAKKRQNEPVKKENSDMKEIKDDVDKQEGTHSETSEGNPIISSGKNKLFKICGL